MGSSSLRGGCGSRAEPTLRRCGAVRPFPNGAGAASIARSCAAARSSQPSEGGAIWRLTRPRTAGPSSSGSAFAQSRRPGRTSGRPRRNPFERSQVRTLALVVMLSVAWVLAPLASARTVLLGRSWQGRPIDAVEVGNRLGTPVLVVGCIHGNETGGIAIARALERLSPHDLDLWIVPDLNPDGVAASSRKNAHGVDLNRNFPWRWRPLNGVYESGPHPLSEREAQIAHSLILRLRPHLTIWFHQHRDM